MLTRKIPAKSYSVQHRKSIPTEPLFVPEASWHPFAEQKPGRLMMIQYVGYEGIFSGSELFFGKDEKAVGAFAKKHLPTIQSCSQDDYFMTDEWRAFLQRHKLPILGDEDVDLDGATDEQLQSALRKEPDEVVTRLLAQFDADRDAEGHYSSLVVVKEQAFLGLETKQREQYFESVFSGKNKLFQVCLSGGYLSGQSWFLRAPSRADAFATVLHDRKHPLFAGILDALCSRYIRVAGELPEGRRQIEAFLRACSPPKLEENLRYCYDKSNFVSFSLVEAAVPFLV